jgi:hypothetical protein
MMSSLIQQYDVGAPHFDHTKELPKVMDKGALCGCGHQRKICKQTTTEDNHRLTSPRSAKSKPSPKFLLSDWSRTPELEMTNLLKARDNKEDTKSHGRSKCSSLYPLAKFHNELLASLFCAQPKPS